MMNSCGVSVISVYLSSVNTVLMIKSIRMDLMSPPPLEKNTAHISPLLTWLFFNKSGDVVYNTKWNVGTNPLTG